MSEHARPVRYWAGGAAAALVVGVGGFLAVTSSGSHSASATSASFNQQGGQPAEAPNGASGPSQGGTQSGTPPIPPGAESGSSNTGAPGRGRGFDGPRADADGAFGTLKSVSGTTLTLTAPAPPTNSSSSSTSTKTVTVDTTGSTTFAKVAAGTVSDLKVGDNVRVMGSTSGSTVTAQRIDDIGTTPLPTPPASSTSSAQARPMGHGVEGTITSISPLTVKEPSGASVTVTTSSSTDVTTQQTIGIADLKVGDAIRAAGTTASDGTVSATTVVDLGTDTGPGAMAGGPGGGPGDMGRGPGGMDDGPGEFGGPPGGGNDGGGAPPAA